MSSVSARSHTGQNFLSSRYRPLVGPLINDRGNTPAEAARVAGLAGIAVIAGRGGIGWLLDRFNAARLLACVCLAVITSLLLLVSTRGKLVDAFAALLLGSVLGAEVDLHPQSGVPVLAA